MNKEKREDRRQSRDVDERSEEKIIKGNFSDDRIVKFADEVKEKIFETAAELQLPVATIVGVLDLIKHEIQHEFYLIDSNMIDWG